MSSGVRSPHACPVGYLLWDVGREAEASRESPVLEVGHHRLLSSLHVAKLVPGDLLPPKEVRHLQPHLPLTARLVEPQGFQEAPGTHRPRRRRRMGRLGPQDGAVRQPPLHQCSPDAAPPGFRTDGPLEHRAAYHHLGDHQKVACRPVSSLGQETVALRREVWLPQVLLGFPHGHGAAPLGRPRFRHEARIGSEIIPGEVADRDQRRTPEQGCGTF